MFKEAQKVIETVRQGFRSRPVLVVEDLMVHRSLRGMVERTFPEAPVPVVQLDRKTHAAGGAANVAANLGGPGCRVAVVGKLGTDEDGHELLNLAQGLGNVGNSFGAGQAHDLQDPHSRSAATKVAF